LLKIITGTLKPSTGNVVVRGKIAAILELGMGFHPDLTGRQNAYHAAGLMGYTHVQIDSVINDIEAFAEIGDYFDQPVRVYSSGMQARVAFAVATAFKPDILIVDEALSVGDAYFQSKCFAQMNKLKQSGVSILIVSHDMQAIKVFCNRAVLIAHGVLIHSGDTKEVAQLYEKISDEYLVPVNNLAIVDTCENILEADVRFLNCQVFVNDLPTTVIETGADCVVKFSYEINRSLKDPHYGFRIADRFGNSVFESNTYCLSISTQKIENNGRVEVSVLFSNILAPGEYIVDVAIVNDGYNRKLFKESLLMNHNVAQLKVVTSDLSYIFAGVCDLKPNITIRLE
jgi:lipopolysaccharide transport system ATP-binding protein